MFPSLLFFYYSFILFSPENCGDYNDGDDDDVDTLTTMMEIDDF